MICKFFCPHCGQHISTDSEVQGITVNCPTCNGEFIAPISIAVPPQPERAPQATPPPLPPATQSYLVTVKAEIARILSARKPLWLSISLLIIATGAIVFTLRGVAVNANNPGVFAEILTATIGRMLLGGGGR